MILLGTMVNGLCIILGTIIGRFLYKMPQSLKTTTMQAIGLFVVVIGLQMALKGEQMLIVVISLVLGVVLGELWKLEDRLNSVGKWIEMKLSRENEVDVAKGFVSATLIFVVGAMAIVGSLDSGLRGDHSVLITKGIIDGFTSILLTASLGIGVLFSFIPVVIYQGTITLLANQIQQFAPEELLNTFIANTTATGGIMIMAIGLNMLELTKIKVANMLPAIIVVVFLTILSMNISF